MPRGTVEVHQSGELLLDPLLAKGVGHLVGRSGKSHGSKGLLGTSTGRGPKPPAGFPVESPVAQAFEWST